VGEVAESGVDGNRRREGRDRERRHALIEERSVALRLRLERRERSLAKLK
jgi:hypothetical protein